MSQPSKPIPVIINPSSGKPNPILHTVNETFRAHKLSWQGFLTYQSGDATRYAQQAAADGADMVVVYGGDGTVLEVVNGVIGTDTAVGIIPGGTGNAVATELGISRDIQEATTLICQSQHRLTVDVAEVDGRYYLLRVYTGVTKEEAASRNLKDKYHLLAYPMEVVKVLEHAPHAMYTVTVDGQQSRVKAMTCFVNNIDNLGGFDIDIGRITPDDGLVDVMIVSKDRHALEQLGHYVLHIGREKAHGYHFQGKEVTLEADPPQPVWLDGEYFKDTPVTIRVRPHAVKIVVP